MPPGPKEAILAAAIGLLLLFVPGVGAIQATMAAVLVGGLSWALNAQQEGEEALQAWWKRILLAIVWALLMVATPFLYYLWVKQISRDGSDTTIHVLPLVIMVVGFLAGLWQTVQGRASLKGLAQGALVGLLTTGVWSFVGAIVKLNDVLRFHPFATLALALTALTLMARDTLRRRGRTAFRFWAFLGFQVIGLYLYGMVAATSPTGTLGSVPSDAHWSSNDGRFTALAEERDETVMLYVQDANCGQRRYLKTIYGPFAGLQFKREGDTLIVQWFTAERHSFEGDLGSAMTRFLGAQRPQELHRDLTLICGRPLGRS